ncbi:MAG TPA: hypothetical protein PLX20_15910 [Rhodocyclaceae bacterium]|nr:hypothetical protein [Rhodocyclaceae bacterium]HNB80122.1 hypothetical protein [Rhodocyclaceae bacterium]HNH14623.1 hypothetical protein [Rhodocyclaceae bacterium]
MLEMLTTLEGVVNHYNTRAARRLARNLASRRKAHGLVVSSLPALRAQVDVPRGVAWLKAVCP